MGDKNQELFLTKLIPSFEGRILEVGSKDYGNTSSFRNHYPKSEYVGIDLEAGKGVDEIVDLVDGIGKLKSESFDLAICCSVLEHVRRPWDFAKNLSSLVKQGGILYISVPWVWRYHAYPDDYWRFSWRGIEELFPEFEWREALYSTNIIGELFPAKPGSDDQAHFLKQISGGRSRKYLPYLNINMLGERAR